MVEAGGWRQQENKLRRGGGRGRDAGAECAHKRRVPTVECPPTYRPYPRQRNGAPFPELGAATAEVSETCRGRV
eukprot:551161-Rhodomonas_salina.2